MYALIQYAGIALALALPSQLPQEQPKIVLTGSSESAPPFVLPDGAVQR